MNDSTIQHRVTVAVVYLARLREAFGTAHERLTLERENPVTARDIVAALASRGGAFAVELAAGRAVRIAVNHAIVSPEAQVNDGDEVALLPPVTGG